MKRSLKNFIPALLFSAFLFCPFTAQASVQDEISAKNAQIQELERQVAEYQAQAEAAGTQSKTLQNEITRLNARINAITAEVKSLTASIDRTGLEIGQTQQQIGDAEQKIILHRSALAITIRATDEADRQTLAFILLQHPSLSDFFDYVHSIQKVQDRLGLAIQSIQSLQDKLDGYVDELQDRQAELERLKGLQEVQQRSLASVKTEKNQLLISTKGREDNFQKLAKNTQAALQRLKEQLYYLQQSGVAVEDAARYAKIAAIGAGIRPAFLLALLEVESRLGLNVGTGNWRDDMYLCYMRLADIAKTATRKQYYRNRAEAEKSAFLQITGSLGLNPDSQKVSKEPSYGCGGAMGPAQFLPSTWLGYAAKVTQITGRSATNPWNIEDAFTAAAIKLAQTGATSQTRAGEIAAAKAYISGNPNCSQSICNYYVNTILNKAAEIAKNL